MMRTNPFIIITLLLAGQASANMIPLSALRSVSVSGAAGQSSYSGRQSLSAPFGDFVGNVSGSANGQYVPLESPHADSSASQTSTIAEDELSVDVNLVARSGVSLSSFPGIAATSSSFEVTFNVLEPLAYQLGGFRNVFYHAAYPPEINFLLNSASYGTILGGLPFSALYGDGFAGTLLPDIYTLRFNADISTFPDPLGESIIANYGMNLRVTPVPDAGSTLALLGLALCAIGGICRKFNVA